MFSIKYLMIMDKIPATKTQKIFIISQITLRILAMAATLAAAWIVLTSKQATVVYGFQVDARYSYSPALKFFAYANLIAYACSVLSLFVIFIFVNKAVNPKNYFYIFLHDLTITLMLLGGCSIGSNGSRFTWGNMGTTKQVGCQFVFILPNSATNYLFQGLCLIQASFSICSLLLLLLIYPTKSKLEPWMINK